MTPLALLLLIVVLVWFWQVSQHCRDLAIVTARETCKRQGVQFLDGTASLQTIRPYFKHANGPGIKRTYTFDYSEDGIERRTGCIIMHNARISAVLVDS
ncbi:MAG: DUF3301 domain-containing protein [Gammaproteobacteria bacterium]|jgi:hypothetical protein|nr:DUF3301 domain-containing protein [Gammaproteobacteria bacterium]